jgi:peptide/nickel transport system substrate-binding protein
MNWSSGGRSLPRTITRPRRLGRLLGTGGAIAAAALGVAACGSSSSSSNVSSSGQKHSYGTILFGSLPPVGTPASGGTITESQITGQTPVYIFPIVPGADTSTYDLAFISSMWLPLYDGPVGAVPKVDYSLSAASGPPVASDGDRQYTIHLKSGLKWSNGAPVDAQDMVFEIDLLKAAVAESPANWGQYITGQFPEDVTSATAPNSTTVVIKLNRPYNPGYFLNNQLADTNNVFPLPATDWNVTGPGKHVSDWSNPAVAKKIYTYLNKEGSSVSSFATNPLWQDVDGPLRLKSFSATNSSYVQVPNSSYGLSPKPRYAALDTETFTSATSILDALKTGSLDIGGLDPSQLNSIPALKSAGYSVFGSPIFGWFGGYINFNDDTDHFNKVISQLYVRAAIMELYDQPAIIKGIYHGAAVPGYAPIAEAPVTSYTPKDATTPLYPYDPAKAVALLKSHGWHVVPNGTTTCAKPGSGSGECGAGIPKGTPISFTWANVPESTSTTGVLESEALSSEAKKAAGININLVTKTFSYLEANYTNANPAGAKNHNAWGVNNEGGYSPDYYPTMDGVFNTGGPFNDGSYSSAQTNSLINQSVYGKNPKAVVAELSQEARELPVFYGPAADIIVAVSKKVGGSPDAMLALTQEDSDPSLMYTTK